MEGFVGSSVVGVEYPPGFQLGDGAFDDVAELVDAGVELFAVVGEVVAGGFADGGDHPGADIGFVGDEGLGWQGLEQATGSQGGQVVGGAGLGGEIQARFPDRVQATWMVTPVVWCLPEYSSGRDRQDQHGSSVPSMTYGVLGCSSSTVVVQVAVIAARTGVSALMVRETVG